MPFTQALRGLQAAGESPDALVNIVAAEVSRQWRDQMKVANQKVRAGEISREESQEFFSGREDAIAQAITEVLGQGGLAHWDKQRLLRRAGASAYRLSEAEATELARIEKEREQHRFELNAALNAGEIDPLDYEQQTRQLEQRYQQLRAGLLTEDRRVREDEPPLNLRAEIEKQLRPLQLRPEELDALAAASLREWRARQDVVASMAGAPEAARSEALRQLEALEGSAEREWERLLGPQRFAELRKLDDYRYQQMKQFQNVWQLSDADVNHLYETLVQYEKALEAYRAATTPSTARDETLSEDPSGRPDGYEQSLKQQRNAELLRFLGEDRFRRFQAAGVVPAD